ncbi:MAG TPA: PAS domain S-box protein [Dehalococcoidia bacterium]|nr:PAS domain S-box protein [Dehalococcoidia bacterium]
MTSTRNGRAAERAVGIAVTSRRAASEHEPEQGSVIESTPVIVWSVDENRRVTGIAGDGLNELGLSPGAAGIAPPTDNQEALDRAFAGEVTSFDLASSGRTFRVTYTRVTDAAGAAQRVVGTAWDVTGERTADWARALAYLGDGEERFHRLAENSVDAVLRVDVEGRFIDFSPSFAASTGFSAAEIRAMNVEEIVHEDDRPALRKRMAVYRVDDRPVRTRARIRRKDGGYYWSEGISCPVRDPATGVIREVHTIARDITEQVLAEEALRASEERYRLLAEESSDLIATYDTAGTYTYASPSAERLLGYQAQELLGRNAFEFVHPDDRESTLMGVLDAAREKRSGVTALYRVCRGDGEIAWLESSVRPVRDSVTRRVSHYHLIARDVTDRVRVEESLRESEERYRLLAEESSDLIAVLDREGTYLYASPSSERVLGHPPGELQGRNAFDFMHEEDRERTQAAVREATRNHEPLVHVAYRVPREGGALSWVESSIRPVRDPETGWVARFHIVARDITDQVRAEAALRDSEERYRHLSEDAADIVGRIAPDWSWSYISPAVKRVLGYDPSDVVGTNVFVYLHPEDVERLRELDSRGTREPVTVQHRAVHANGTIVWMETSIRSLQDPATGVPREFHLIARDVSSRVAAQVALRESEERYRHLAEDSTDIIARFAPGGRWLYASPALSRVLGYRPDEVVGTSVYDLFDPAEAERMANLEIANPSKPVTVVHRALHKHGHEVWVETSLRSVADPISKEITEYHGTSRDVTARVQVEQALRESEERFRLLAENSTDLIARHSRDGTYVYVSPSATAILGYAPEQLMGRNAFDFIDAEEQAAVREAARGLMPGVVCYVTFRARHASGAWIWLEASLRAVADPTTGEVTEWHTAARDITERMLAQERISSSEQRYRLLAEHSGDVVATISSTGRIIYVSPATLRMTGYAPEELIGQPYGLLVHPEDLPSVNERFQNARQEGVATVRVRTVRKDGGIIWTETVARTVEGLDDHLRIYTVTRDINQNVLDEEALRESEELFRRMFDESPAPIALTDKDGILARVNDAYSRMLGYRREDMAGRHFLEFCHPQERTAAQEGHSAIFAGRTARIHRQKRYLTRDGREVLGMLTAAPIHNAKGEAVAILSIVEDMTEQKRVRDELQQIAAMKSDFVTLVSHELRAPLTNMLGGLELIAHGSEHLPETAHRTLAILTDETERLNRFVETILDVSRLDAGQLPIVLGPVAVNVVVDRATRAIAASNNTPPEVRIAPDLPLAWADELQLEHVLRNLIQNAEHHGPAGHPIAVEVAAGANDIEVRITDEGPGISAADLPHVFEAFRRSADSDLRYKGYGLGLYFAKRLVEAQGGSIRAESPVQGGEHRREHGGARFTVRIPLAQQGG